MVEFKNRPQRLYLAKNEKEEIYVDTVGLLEHQYEGIRFLYRQYKKGNPGAVLNDPPGYGMRVQAVSFISAMRPVLKLPTLILTSECREQLWQRRFSKWTDMESAVAIQGTQEIINPRVVVSNPCHTCAHARREWGLVVVDDDNAPRDLNRARLAYRFSVWITHVELQKNLQMFSVIYRWLYPKVRFVADEFKASKKSPVATFAAAAKLDALMEHVVLRRSHVTQSPREGRQELLSPVRITRKNKDATGKKIKRSKPNTERVSEIIEPQAFAISQELVSQCNNGELSRKEASEDFIVHINDVEIAKGDKVAPSDNAIHKPESKEIKLEVMKDNVVPKHNKLDEPINEEKERTEVMETDNVTPKLDAIAKIIGNKKDIIENKEEKSEVMEIDKEKEVSEIMETEVNDIREISRNDEAVRCDENETFKLLDSEINSQNLVIKYDSDTPDSDDYITNTKTNTSNVNENKLLSEELFSDVNKVDPPDVVENVNKNDRNVTSKEQKTDIDGIEFKIKQMEEIAMKKFKGSLLDNMF